MRIHAKVLNSWRIIVARLRRDESGQDMIEYALLAASLVVIVAGFLPPHLMPAVSTIFSRITSTLNGS